MFVINSLHLISVHSGHILGKLARASHDWFGFTSD